MRKLAILAIATFAVSLSAFSAEESSETLPEPISPNVSVVSEQPSAALEVAPKLKIEAEARIDFDLTNTSPVAPGDHATKAGFHGRYLNLILSGDITPQLSYRFRQRLNKFQNFKNDVFSATDVLYLTWAPNEHWTFSGGKQVVAIGGYEYDAAPIDIYFASLYWNNIACYQFGVSAAYTFKGDNHTLTAQFCNSPYQPIGKTCFAYNLMWNGRMGCYSTIWSVNAMEFKRGKFACEISLGNRFDFMAGRFPMYFETDLMNRYAPHQRFFLDNYTVIGRMGIEFGSHFNLFVKGGYERYKPVLDDRYSVKNPFGGIGLEYFPLRNNDRRLRIDLVADLTHGFSARTAPVLNPETGLTEDLPVTDTEGYQLYDRSRSCRIQLGVTWKMDLFTLKAKKKSKR